MSVLIFFLVLFLLVLVHEFGHFIVAKWSGMRVDEFGIGFPPKLISKKYGETEYTFNLFPIGGFVRIYGEDALTGGPAKDSQRSFTARPRWAQSLVLIAGVTMNILFAWLLFAAVFMIGSNVAVDASEAGEDARLIVASVVPDSPAAMAGLAPNTDITGLSQADGTSLEELTPEAFRDFVASSEGELTFTGIESTTSITPTQGIVADDPNRAAIGVTVVLVEHQSLGFVAALREATMLTATGLRDITVGVLSLLRDTFTLSADLSQVAGPVGIVGLVGEASAFGITSIMLFTAFISLNLAVINMLPFPALDGGRLLFVAIEAMKGSPIQPRWVHGLNTLGFLLLILLMVAITANDIARII